MRLHIPTISLLSAAFLLGCQDRSEPVGPEGLGSPAAARGGGGKTVSEFEATLEGDVIFLPLGTVITLFNREGSVFLTAGGKSPKLDLSFFRDNITGGNTCFAADGFTGAFQTFLWNDDPTGLEMLFSFRAKGTDGTTVKYALRLFGASDKGDPLPPAVSDDVNWSTFDMDHENGPGRKVACSGTGGLISVMHLVRK